MQALPSTMSQGHQFSRVPQANIPRSSFNRSHGRKMTFDAGYLNVFYRDWMLPGDTFNLHATILARLSSTALNKPVMDNMYLETFFLACPWRLVWANSKKFFGEQEPVTYTAFLIPTMETPVSGVITGSLSNQLGIPYFAAVKAINSLWHRFYNLAWNQLFRDENLQASVTVDTDDGVDSYNDYVLLKRGKRHDYFTSALPFLQKGVALTLPIAGSAPVKTSSNSSLVSGVQNTMMIRQAVDGTAGTPNRAVGLQNDGITFGQTTTATTDLGAGMYPSNLYADLTLATSATINAMRQSIALQQMLEIDARAGTRYIELVKGHFGVTSPDMRQQRVEFLGSGQTRININPVAGTNQVGSGSTAAGQLTAYGTAVGGGHGFTYSATEHTLLLGLVCVRADLTYQQGIHKDFLASTKYDIYWPTLANIGEESVLQGEIYALGTSDDNIVFGYQERYASYRYKPSEIVGTFTSNPSGGITSLEAYHLSQDFSAAPTLGPTFIVETPPMARIKAVTTEPDFLADIWIDLKCARPMPLYGVPGLMRL